MIEAILGALAGYAVCKFISPLAQSLGLPISSDSGVTPSTPIYTTNPPARRAAPPAQAPSDSRGVPTGPITPKPAAPVVLTSTAPAYPSQMPAGLPPFPAGWQYAKPLTPAITQRAAVLLKAMKPGETKTETAPDGRWITYVKQTAKGKSSVTAWQPKAGAASTTTQRA